MSRGRRSAEPSTGVLTAVAAIGVSAAIAMLQLAPAIGPVVSTQVRPTPLGVPRQELTYVGQGASDVAIYRTELSQVCPASALDCVETEKVVRTPLELPADMRAGNFSLSPSGNQLALVGHVLNEDVIAVVTMPNDSGNSQANKGGNGNAGKGNDRQKTPDPEATSQSGSSSSGGGPAKSRNPDANSQQSPDPAQAAPSDAPGGGNGGNNGNGGGNGNGDSDVPPSSVSATAVPGLAVVSILDNVQSAGAAPDWSANGSMLAFSAMPDDGSRGPDV